MVKKNFIRILAIVFCTLLMAAPAMAAGSWSTPVVQYAADNAGDPQRYLVITATFTADASAATVPDLALAASTYGYQGYSLIMLLTDPGTTAPTDNYDITVDEALVAGGSTVNTTDVMGGEAMNRDTATSEQAVPLVGGVYGARAIMGGLTITVSNNSVNSATCAVALIFKR